MSSKQPPNDIPEQLVAVKKQILTSGPLPAPEILSKYKDINPEYPERIFRMAELEQKHRLENDQYLLQMQKTGLLLSFVLAVCSLLAAVALGSMGALLSAAVVGSMGVGGVYVTSILGKIIFTKGEN